MSYVCSVVYTLNDTKPYIPHRKHITIDYFYDYTAVIIYSYTSSHNFKHTIDNNCPSGLT